MSAATYPLRPKPADLSLGRTLALLRACSDRMADPYIPLRSQGEHPGLMELADFRLAIVSDEQRAVLSKYLPTDADFRQALYAIGTHCVFHGTEFAPSDPDRKTCLPCEFDTADRRYRGHAVIPFPAGEVVNVARACGAPDFFAPGVICKLPSGHDGLHCGDNCPDGMCNTCEPRR